MRRRRRWKSRPATGNKRKALFIVLVILFLFSVQTYIYIETHLKEPLMDMAEIRVKQRATEAINTAITNQISDYVDKERLIDWKTDNSGKTIGFILNSAEHMRIAVRTTNVVQNTLDELQAIPQRIPIGQVFDSAIMATYGPEIEVRFVPEGAVEVNLHTRQQDAGINMVYVEVFVQVIVDMKIIIPFDSELETVKTEVPVTYVLVAGEVPMYYFDYDGSRNPEGMDQFSPPNLSVPSFNPMREERETVPSQSVE